MLNAGEELKCRTLHKIDLVENMIYPFKILIFLTQNNNQNYYAEPLNEISFYALKSIPLL